MPTNAKKILHRPRVPLCDGVPASAGIVAVDIVFIRSMTPDTCFGPAARRLERHLVFGRRLADERIRAREVVRISPAGRVDLHIHRTWIRRHVVPRIELEIPALDVGSVR
jgi:hypothetical protein